MGLLQTTQEGSDLGAAALALLLPGLLLMCNMVNKPGELYRSSVCSRVRNDYNDHCCGRYIGVTLGILPNLLCSLTAA